MSVISPYGNSFMWNPPPLDEQLAQRGAAEMLNVPTYRPYAGIYDNLYSGRGSYQNLIADPWSSLGFSRFGQDIPSYYPGTTASPGFAGAAELSWLSDGLRQSYDTGWGGELSLGNYQRGYDGFMYSAVQAFFSTPRLSWQPIVSGIEIVAAPTYQPAVQPAAPAAEAAPKPAEVEDKREDRSGRDVSKPEEKKAEPTPPAAAAPTPPATPATPAAPAVPAPARRSAAARNAQIAGLRRLQGMGIEAEFYADDPTSIKLKRTSDLNAADIPTFRAALKKLATAGFAMVVINNRPSDISPRISNANSDAIFAALQASAPSTPAASVPGTAPAAPGAAPAAPPSTPGATPPAAAPAAPAAASGPVAIAPAASNSLTSPEAIASYIATALGGSATYREVPVTVNPTGDVDATAVQIMAAISAAHSGVQDAQSGGVDIALKYDTAGESFAKALRDRLNAISKPPYIAVTLRRA